MAGNWKGISDLGQIFPVQTVRVNDVDYFPWIAALLSTACIGPLPESDREHMWVLFRPHTPAWAIIKATI